MLKGRAGQRIVYTIRVMSLGEWREAGAIETRFQPNDTLAIKVGWDPATGSFGHSSAWSSAPAAAPAGNAPAQD